ncbi:hypothetical protein [Campylobacter geochelonis]|nr:hypothetical protein [Campylobacter geochelonis]CZE48309.1 Small hydrophobic protein [Campylobacter geochelonis]CZE50072.1 Small hydrophobic protein [Campylobacter geochelonis]
MNFVVTCAFVIFMIVLVVGFNKQMKEKNDKREEKKRKEEDR